MFKKIIAVLIIFVFSFFILTVSAEKSEKPKITSSAYVLYNPDNDEIVESKNQDLIMYPASLTKMMTALVVVDLCEDLDNEKVTVSDNAIKSLYGTGSSTANIRKGEIFTVKQLLYLMLLPSGNDAANALADHFNSKNYNFIELMNNKAYEIGMKSTNFVNPHGLHEEKHYSTAADLARLATEYMKNSLLFDIARCNEYTLPKTNIQAERIIRTTNFMKVKNTQYYYPYATGLKTGYTYDSGRCFAGSAEKDGKSFICIFLNTPEVWNRYGLVRTEFLEAAELFDYAFKTYETVNIVKEGTKISSLPVIETRDKYVNLGFKEDIFVTLPKDADISKIITDFTPENLIDNKYASAPVEKGTNFGTAKLVLDNKILAECDIIALNTVKPNSLIVLWHKINLYLYIFLAIIGFVILLIISLVIRKRIILYKRKKEREKRELRRQKRREAFLKAEPYDYFKMELKCRSKSK